jgi:hypothetical protein
MAPCRNYVTCPSRTVFGMSLAALFLQGVVAGKEGTMPHKSPWNSTKSDVYHNNSSCETGDNIEQANVQQGTGGKRLCDECERRNREGK